MQVTAYKTHKITKEDNNLFTILDTYLPNIEEKAVVAVTSKIVAICEGRMVKTEDTTKDQLVDEEAELYLPRELNKYDFSISIKWNTFTASGGVDESNGNGYYILWPKDPQASANAIREHLVEKYGLKDVGVIITDSKTSPLRWGVTGVALAHSGFAALKSYIGEPDIFGRKLKVEKLSVMDTLAGASVGVMGEGEEQTPLAVITDVPFVTFQQRNPTLEELQMLHIEPEDDLFGPMLTAVAWKKGQGKNPYGK